MNNRYKKKTGRIYIKLVSVMIFLAFLVCALFLNMAFKHRKVIESNYSKDVKNDDYGENNDVIIKDNSTDSKDTESIGKYEDAAYVEKYIEQQIKGEMPDGADGKKVAYLTFDDGPSETVTPKILDILKKENVNATFFVVGKNVDVHKELLKREASEGNAIGIHSYSHNYHYLFPENKIDSKNCIADFEKTNMAIKNVMGENYEVRALRFPGGLMSWRVNDPQGAQAVEEAIHEREWYQIDWNCLSGDAEGNSPKNAEQLYEEAVKTIGTREKAVILMHDEESKLATAEALPKIIQYLKQQGYEFETIK